MARSDARKKAIEWDEFECPECTAHNPYGRGFVWGDEVFCSFCGQSFLVKKLDDELEGPRYRLELL